MATLVDLEYAYLGTLGATGTLNDRRFQVYGAEEHAYFAALSGLTPAPLYSLADHKYAYFKGAATAWVTQRTNLSTNPTLSVDAANWAAGNVNPGGATSGARIVGGGPSGENIFRKEWTAGDTAPGAQSTMDAAGTGFVSALPVDALSPYSASIWFKTTNAETVRLSMVQHDSGGGIVGVYPATQVALAAGVWTQLSNSLVTQAATTKVRLSIQQPVAYQHIIGDRWEGTGLLFEKAPSVGSNFSGDTPDPGPLAQYEWVGAAGQSASVYQTRLSNVASSGSLADVQRRFWSLALGLE